ncbi:MAG: hypothetical protein QOF04_3266 [Solirubrobacteraceae bacterium]|jgi:hypothetical protein|nr:hypothetical protein [Solirubrobacteraceae bacterium]
MESSAKAPERLPADAACAGILALLIEAREARSPSVDHANLEALLAGAGLGPREIALITGQDSDTVDARLNADGPALWRTLQRQRAAMADADPAR